MKLNFKSVLLMSAVAISFYACGGSTKPAEEKPAVATTPVAKEGVPFDEAKNYFVSNKYNETGVKTIVDQVAFDSIFGMATTMGADGKPTPIDFATSYVIAVIGEKSNKKPEIVIEGLEKDGDKIVLNYTITENEEASYTSKPSSILIVDKKYTGNVEGVKK